MKLYFLDKFGWPVERVKGRPISGLIRLWLHTKRITFTAPNPLVGHVSNVSCNDGKLTATIQLTEGAWQHLGFANAETKR